MVLTRSRSKSSEVDAKEVGVKITPNKNNNHKGSKAKTNKTNQNGTPSKIDEIKVQEEEKSSINDQADDKILEKSEEISNDTEETAQVKNKKKKEKSNYTNGNVAPETLSSLTEKILSNPLSLTAPKSNASKDPHLQLMTKVLDLGKLTQFGQDGPFEQIRMKGLNMEQIWGQMNLKNNSFLDRAGNAIKEWYGDDAMDVDDDMDMDDDEDDLMDEELDEDEDEEDEDEENSEEDDDDELEEEEEEEEFQGFGEHEDEDEEIEEEEIETLSAPKRTYEVDDEFFSLEKMEEFVQEAERNEMKEDEEEEEEDEDDIDLFVNPDELDDSDADVDVNDIKFSDFFLPNSKKSTSRSKLSFKKGVDDQDLEESDEQMDVDEVPDLEDDNEELEDEEDTQKSAFKVKKASNLFDDDDDIMVDEDGEPLSNFEKKQAQMSEIIHDLEMQNLDNKTWTMKGEATSKDRPLNSLLEEDLEFDYASKPAPLITEEVTHDLEDLIKRRIIEKQFDDVEKKVAPKVREYQPREQLDQEKSLRSLGEVYEDEYQAQVAGLPAKQQEKLSKAHQEIEELFNNVMNKLTSLSNFHYTPKAPQLKVQVVENVGAIQMEEALPTAISDAQTLAPEEVYEKSRGEIKSTEEMDSEEKKRLRNRKKRLAKLRSKDKPDPKDKVDPMIANLPKV